MTEINPAGFFQNLSTHTAEQMRSYLGSILAVPSGASSLKTASGVHPALGGQLAVTQNGTPNMSINVASGFAFISGTEGTKQGTYFCENDATVNKSITASDPTNPRIDIVVAKIQDAFYSGATNAWSLAVVTGTPAASPSAPAAPANSTILAQIAVAANATSIVTGNITDKRAYAAALGGSLVTTSTTHPGTPYKGLVIIDTDFAPPKVQVYDGVKYQPINPQMGAATFTLATTSPTATNFTSTSYVNIALNGGVNANVSFTKAFDDTRVLVRFSTSCFCSNAGTVPTFGVNINSTDYDMTKMYFNNNLVHITLPAAERILTGIPKNTFTVWARIKVSANTFTIDNFDNLNLSVQEIV